ncbi:nocturnin-like isoform X1 [Gadus macrocephalus]|uniref:nocturnin-like isoform X1 n=2 Tax=Gadus macrocephalus TaxID=80720 RepID=UPI0028CB6B62|nr:nocturnin-like isoform X1 [Gadus macrocephalus]
MSTHTHSVATPHLCVSQSFYVATEQTGRCVTTTKSIELGPGYSIFACVFVACSIKAIVIGSNMETMGCPMGGGATRLYSTIGGGGRSLPLTPAHLARQNPPPEREPQPSPCKDSQGPSQLDPDPLEQKLLRECEEALRGRPPRFHRPLVHCGDGQRAPGAPIRVLQWNILAQALGEGADCFVRCPPEALSWPERKYLILEEILTYKPHILCLQEVDHYYDTFQPVLRSLGYGGHFFPKPWSPCLGVHGNNGPDGCALFFDQSRFELLESVSVRLSALLIPTNQIAVVTKLRCRATAKCVFVAVTHLKARSGWERLRGAQGSDLLAHLQTLLHNHRHPPGTTGPPDAAPSLIICGDFNAVPEEEVYQRFASSPLRLDSAYKKLSRDGATEPPFTTWKIRPSGECCSTLDYIWYGRDCLQVEAVLDLPTEEQIGPDRLPSFHYPSDHLSLICDFSFKEER